jgi:hypothetical protein
MFDDKETAMRYASASVLLAVVIVQTRGVEPGTPDPAPSPVKTEWRLPSSLSLRSQSLDVSSDRKSAVVWGKSTADAEARNSCWLIDLQTGKTEDLSAQVGDEAATSIRNPKGASFSPDGKQLLVSAADGKNICILDLSTRKAILITRPDRFQALWFGERLLLSVAGKPAEVCDATGRRVEELKLQAQILAGDPTGSKLLVITKDAVMAVASPEGKVLRELASQGDCCPRDKPLLSRFGNWAGVYCMNKNEWSYCLVSTTTDEVFRLRRPWGATLALTETGDSIFLTSGKGDTFSATTRGGEGCSVVFWPKDDDPWKSTEGAAGGPESKDLIANRMPRGNSQVLADKAMAVALLGGELFVVKASADERMLKAIPLPQSRPPAADKK